MYKSLVQFATAAALGVSLLGSAPAAAAAESSPDSATAGGGVVMTKKKTNEWSGTGTNAKKTGTIPAKRNVTTMCKVKDKHVWYRFDYHPPTPDRYARASNFYKPSMKISWCKGNP